MHQYQRVLPPTSGPTIPLYCDVTMQNMTSQYPTAHNNAYISLTARPQITMTYFYYGSSHNWALTAIKGLRIHYERHIGWFYLVRIIVTQQTYSQFYQLPVLV